MRVLDSWTSWKRRTSSSFWMKPRTDCEWICRPSQSSSHSSLRPWTIESSGSVRPQSQRPGSFAATSLSR